MFSTIQDQQSSELSQGHIARRAKRLKVDQQELKLPRVTALDASQASAARLKLQSRSHSMITSCLLIGLEVQEPDSDWKG